MKSSKKKSKHPSLDIVASHGTELSGKRIVLCVAGSVAVYKAIELARLLMRHGGNVVCVESYYAILHSKAEDTGLNRQKE